MYNVGRLDNVLLPLLSDDDALGTNSPYLIGVSVVLSRGRCNVPFSTRLHLHATINFMRQNDHFLSRPPSNSVGSSKPSA